MTKTVTRQTSTRMDYHKHDRWFMIAKILLVLAPFVALTCLQAAAASRLCCSRIRRSPLRFWHPWRDRLPLIFLDLHRIIFMMENRNT